MTSFIMYARSCSARAASDIASLPSLGRRARCWQNGNSYVHARLASNISCCVQFVVLLFGDHFLFDGNAYTPKVTPVYAPELWFPNMHGVHASACTNIYDR